MTLYEREPRARQPKGDPVNTDLLAGQRMSGERRAFIDAWVAERLKEAPLAVTVLEGEAAKSNIAPSELTVCLNAAGAYRMDGTIYRADQQ